MKPLFLPQKLLPGDKAALTAPSSPVPAERLKAAVKSVEYLGLEPVVMESCFMSHGYMAGPDKRRAEDINSAFRRKDIKAVFCLRGGFGASRLLPLLDFDMIRENPKIFVGYSDITALHTVFSCLCGFITFHAPMPNTDYTRMDAFSLSRLRELLFEEKTSLTAENPPGEKMRILSPGSCSGLLTGGNLSLTAAALGSPYEIDTKDRILFLEDVDEEPFRLDRYLTALSLAGKLRDCSGVILGTFAGCQGSPEASLTVEEIINEVVLPCGKPVLFNLRAGHIYPQLTLPMGAVAQMDLTGGRPHVTFHTRPPVVY